MNKLLVRLVVISTVIGINLSIVSQAQSGEFNMFSFFSKSNKAPTSISPLVGAELMQETQFPQIPPDITIRSHCRKMRYEGKASATRFIATDRVETPELAFVVDGLAGKNPLALINNPEEGRFDIWSLDASTLKPTLPIDIPSFHPRQNKWSSFFILDVACLPNNQALIAVGYDDPTAKYALFIFDINKTSIFHIADINSNARNHEKYMEYKALNADSVLVLYYSDTKRESAEIYHNYYNHLLLFNSEHPRGLEILKLGIDIGNIEQWTVIGNKIFLETMDSRGHQEPKRSYLSLDLSKLIK